MTPNGIQGNCPAPSSGEQPSSSPQSPAPRGVGQASPQGISGPIPPPSPRQGLAAVNELRGDPNAPCAQGMCPKSSLDGGRLFGGKETERKEERDRGKKTKRMKRKKRREGREGRRIEVWGKRRDRGKESSGDAENQREIVTKTERNLERQGASLRGQ